MYNGSRKGYQRKIAIRKVWQRRAEEISRRSVTTRKMKKYNINIYIYSEKEVVIQIRRLGRIV